MSRIIKFILTISIIGMLCSILFSYIVDDVYDVINKLEVSSTPSSNTGPDTYVSPEYGSTPTISTSQPTPTPTGDISTDVTILMEYAYFEGQKDMLNGDIKISGYDGKYTWTGSPWDSGKQPIYIPDNDITSTRTKYNIY